MWILLDPKLDERKIAYERPLTVPYSSSFVVDVAHPDDIKWKAVTFWITYSVFHCIYSENKDSVGIEKAAPGSSRRKPARR